MNASSAALNLRRAEAAERVRARGLPHRRIEDWKYTDLRAALGESELGGLGAASIHIRNAVPQIEQYAFDGVPPRWFVDHFGKIAPEGFLSDASLAFGENLVALRVPAGLQAAAPLDLEIFGQGQARVLIVVENGASALLREVYSADAFLNVGMEIVLGAGAALRQVRRSSHDDSAVAMANIAVKGARDSVYRGHFMTTGAKLSRSEIHIALEGEGAAAHLSGIGVLGGAAHADVTTHVEHVAGLTQSTQLFKNVAGGRSRAVYQGRITVHQGADGSDSRQTAKAILIGGRAEADLKPELLIFADDVKCAHGAAVGDLDADSLFYLRARGVPEAEARNLLLRAFLEEAAGEIDDEALRAEIWRAAEEALPRAMEEAP
jgi:Fe-S cluster assembly protein SufD